MWWACESEAGEEVIFPQPQFELVKCRVRTVWTRLVMRVVEHRSLRRSRQVYRVAMTCSTRARILACERLTAC